MKRIQVISIFALLIATCSFAQTGQKGDDYSPKTKINLAVIVLDFPDTPDSIKLKYFPTIAALKDTLFNGRIKDYLTDMSYGQFTLTGDVFGYFTNQHPGFVNGKVVEMDHLIMDDMNINIPGFDIEKYDGVVALPVFDAGICGAWSSGPNFAINGNLFPMSKAGPFASICIGYWARDPINYPNISNTLQELTVYDIPISSNSSINGTSSINFSQFDRVFSHEFFHWLIGIGHANSRTNGNLYDYEPEISNNNCKCYQDIAKGSLMNMEYGNKFDVMGLSQFGMSLNSVFRDYAGWTNPSNRFSIKDYGHYTTTISPLNNLTGTRVVEVRIPFKYGDGTIYGLYGSDLKNAGYFLEVRAGIDKWDNMLLNEQLVGNNDGIMVMKTDGMNSLLLDMSPSPNIESYSSVIADLRDVVIKPGMNYDNGEIKLSNVKKNEDGSFSIDIDIIIPFPANQEDSLALVELFNQCNGQNWTQKANWLTGTVATWEGVSVEKGRVVGLKVLWDGLQGQYPAELSALTEIRELTLVSKRMTGPLPASWSALINLTDFTLYGENHITGPLPESWSTLVKLRNLNIANCDIYSTLPASWSTLVNLVQLNLMNNHITGTLPESWSSLMGLRYLFLSRNQLTGSLPESWSVLKGLMALSLDYNNLVGNLPESWSTLENLGLLTISNNLLSGTLPESWSALPRLNKLDLGFNQLRGLPDFSHYTFPNLEYLDVQNNLLDFGDIEPNIGTIFSEFTYSPQGFIGEADTVIRNLGQEFKINITIGGQHNIYQWYKNGLPISGSHSSEYLISSVTSSDEGVYNCEITNTLVTALTLEINPITLHTSTSQTSIVLNPKASLDVWPNPLSTNATIRYTTIIYQPIVIQVIDFSGRVIEELALGNQMIGEHFANWNTSTLENGVYYLRIKDSPGIFKKAIIIR